MTTDNAVNYRYEQLPATIHYAGGYLSISTKRRDVIRSLPNNLMPYVVLERERVLTETLRVPRMEYEYVNYRDEHGKDRTREIPKREVIDIVHKYKNVTHDRTPKPQRFGKAITVGDKVKLSGRGQGCEGILEELNDYYAKIDGQMFFWNGTNPREYMITRA